MNASTSFAHRLFVVGGLVGLVGTACLDGRARVSPKAAWHHELDMPGDDEYTDLIPEEALMSAAMAHAATLASLGLEVADVTEVDVVLNAAATVWPSLDHGEREALAEFFRTVFEHGRDRVLDQIDRRLDEIHADAYISVDVADFVVGGPERAAAALVTEFDAGRFDVDIDALVVSTLRQSWVEVVIAVYIGDVDDLLRDAGIVLANPTDYVAGAVLRSVGARTLRPEEDLDVSADLNRFKDEFAVSIGCAPGQPRLDWIDRYDMRLRQDRALYPHPFGAAWLVTEYPPDERSEVEPGWEVLDQRRGLLAAPDVNPRCGVSLAASPTTYDGIDVTPYVVGDGFTVELRLAGLHAFAQLELASRAQITLELGGG